MTVPELIEKLQALPGDSDLRLVTVRTAARDRYGNGPAPREVTGVLVDVVRVILELD